MPQYAKVTILVPYNSPDAFNSTHWRAQMIAREWFDEMAQSPNLDPDYAVIQVESMSPSEIARERGTYWQKASRAHYEASGERVQVANGDEPHEIFDPPAAPRRASAFTPEDVTQIVTSMFPGLSS